MNEWILPDRYNIELSIKYERPDRVIFGNGTSIITVGAGSWHKRSLKRLSLFIFCFLKCKKAAVVFITY